MSLHEIDALVIGAGVVGLACAKALAEAGREVLVLEALETFGSVTSARNSEVVHAGLHHAPGSAKARLCVRGRHLLEDYCRQRGIAHRRCGKLVVASRDAEVASLDALRERARANGVDDVELLSAAQSRALEPALEAVAALSSPATGIVDSHGLMQSLLADVEARGGLLVPRSRVRRGEVLPGGGLRLEVDADEPTSLRAATVVNAAGLEAVALARRLDGLPGEHVPAPAFCKGSYFALAGRAPFSRLIYPVPEVGGLGVHLTLDLAGQARFGPDTEWLDTTDPHTLSYEVDASKADAFQARIRRYWPGLPAGALVPAYAGVRPKVRTADGAIGADFVISGPADHGVAGLVNLFGIESPGLTSALAIAETVQRAV